LVSEEQPRLRAGISEAEFTRWYWTCAELRAFCRSLGLPSGGVKGEITARVVAHLAGRAAPPALRRARAAGALPERLTDDTPLPIGQRATRRLREHLEVRIGRHFRVDAHVREFLTTRRGVTIGDLVAHWERTRDLPKAPPAAQFEYNRFAQAWHAANPGGGAGACRAAWQAHRARPRERGEG
jgi:hypothetical protein